MEAISTFQELGVGEHRGRDRCWNCSESHFLTLTLQVRKEQQRCCDSLTWDPKLTWWEWRLSWDLEYGLGTRRWVTEEYRGMWVFMVEGPKCTKPLRQEGPSTLTKLKEAEWLRHHQLEREWYKRSCGSSHLGPFENGKTSLVDHNQY